MIEFAVVFFILICGVIVIAAASYPLTSDEHDYLSDLVRRHRRLKTPPCDRCAYYVRALTVDYCKCPDVVELASRKNGISVKCTSIDDARGTRRCKFKEKEEAE